MSHFLTTCLIQFSVHCYMYHIHLKCRHLDFYHDVHYYDHKYSPLYFYFHFHSLLYYKVLLDFVVVDISGVFNSE